MAGDSDLRRGAVAAAEAGPLRLSRAGAVTVRTLIGVTRTRGAAAAAEAGPLHVSGAGAAARLRRRPLREPLQGRVTRPVRPGLSSRLRSRYRNLVTLQLPAPSGHVTASGPVWSRPGRPTECSLRT